MSNIYGILDLQRQQLSDIQSIYNSSNIGSAGTLQTSLSNAFTKISGSSGISAATNDALNRQTDVLDIVTEENRRLAQKQDQIENARDGQKRLIMLNDSYRKRYMHYLNMIVAIVIGLFVIFILSLIQRSLGFIPVGIMNILYIVIIAGTLIYVGLIWADLPNHHLIDYDVLQIQGPANPPTKTPVTPQEGGSDLTRPTNICANESCCSDGMVWSDEIGKCVISPASSSTSSRVVQGFQTMAKPNSANEYTDYSEYR